MIAQSTIETIRDLPLESAIGRYVSLNRKGVNYVGKSPFNEENTPSFNVVPAKGIWKDFSSGKGGRDVISFLMQKNNLTFVEAIVTAAEDNNIIVEYDNSDMSKDYFEAIQKKKALIPVLEWAYSEFIKCDVPTEFLKRFPLEVCKQFNIGGCSGLIDEAKKAGIDLTILSDAGLIASKEGSYYERFINRIIFPITDYRGQLIGFTGRVKGSAKPGEPKYLHSSFEKSKSLFAIYQAAPAIREKQSVFVVEGTTDCMRFHQCNYTNCVAKLGSDLSESQCQLIKRFASEIVLVSDNDEAGLKSIHTNAETAIKTGLTVKILIPQKK